MRDKETARWGRNREGSPEKSDNNLHPPKDTGIPRYLHTRLDGDTAQILWMVVWKRVSGDSGGEGRGNDILSATVQYYTVSQVSTDRYGMSTAH